MLHAHLRICFKYLIGEKCSQTYIEREKKFQFNTMHSLCLYHTFNSDGVSKMYTHTYSITCTQKLNYFESIKIKLNGMHRKKEKNHVLA